ncbi:MAG: hypothetical protein PF569_05590 [Candidatus Woesearchaeota archaeon]|nr:hypothetical protein [Candidatus Woesearchaeota archaeon]
MINYNKSPKYYLLYIMLDSILTDIAVFKQQHSTMNKTIDRIETTQKEGFSEIKTLINGLDKTFATKAEHQANSMKIDNTSQRMAKIEKGIWWFIGLV